MGKEKNEVAASKTANQDNANVNVETTDVVTETGLPTRGKIIGTPGLPVAEINISASKDILVAIVSSTNPKVLEALRLGRNERGIFTKKLSSFNANRLPLGYNAALLVNALSANAGKALPKEEQMVIRVPLVEYVKGREYLSEDGKSTFIAGDSDSFQLDIQDGETFVVFGNWEFKLPESFVASANRRIEKALIQQMMNPVVKEKTYADHSDMDFLD